MNVTSELSAVAAELDRPHELADILRPTWEETCRVHDWRNHIPDALRERWLALSADARVSAYILASRIADMEVWDY